MEKELVLQIVNDTVKKLQTYSGTDEFELNLNIKVENNFESYTKSLGNAVEFHTHTENGRKCLEDKKHIRYMTINRNNHDIIVFSDNMNTANDVVYGVLGGSFRRTANKIFSDSKSLEVACDIIAFRIAIELKMDVEPLCYIILREDEIEYGGGLMNKVYNILFKPEV